jgi:hypothetical protein
MKTTKEKIAIMQAFIEGKTVEYCYQDTKEWSKIDSPAWDWIGCDYRIRVEKVKLYYINYVIDTEEDYLVKVLVNTDKITLCSALAEIKKFNNFVRFVQDDIQEIEI